MTDERATALMEAKCWDECCPHKHVVKLFFWFEQSHFALFVMEKCRCSLLDLLMKGDEIDHDTLNDYFLQMLLGVDHVHSKNIITAMSSLQIF